MDIISVADKDELGQEATRYFESFLSAHDNPLVILPTGNTPLPFYKVARGLQAQGTIKDNSFRYLALDDYAGLPAGDERLFSSWLGREILDPLNIEGRITFDSAAPDADAEIKRMEAVIEENAPLDLAIVGLGTNGHIGFNEPGSDVNGAIHLVDLTPETRTANAAYWDGNIDNVPTQAYTLGLGALKKAKHTLLLVSGRAKAEILSAALNSDISPAIPATYLQQQDNVTIIADEAALSLISS